MVERTRVEPLAGCWGGRSIARFGAERLGSGLAMAMLAATAATWIAEQAQLDEEIAVARAAARDARGLEAASTETMVAGYFGAPFTYPSDVGISNPAETTIFTMANVGWDGKPFKSPIYYGLRVARWGESRGLMLDFTHSKTISRPDETVDLTGVIRGAPAPAKARIGALFKHLEFSHGHNTLLVTGLARLASLAPRVSPYVGVGGGVSLPHTEVQMVGEPARTYEYQYAGPAAQALVGLEFKLANTSVFFEYKFTFADYAAPLSRLDGNILPTDLWRQFSLWWRGEKPPGGVISTRLASHQLISGVGYRFGGR